VRRNYANSVAAQLERVMATTPESVNGRLVLLHGPPGTGKTTALRALGMAWQRWCKIDCVLDPERLLGSPGYLLQVMMGSEAGRGPNADLRKWRLLILEDCDELVRGSAKRAAGQSLSRLLNLTDGLLGQGQNVLVAITTNEELGRLHPAVVRPGRCLAQVEVGPLPRDEAAKWLGSEAGLVGPSATLAELYALKARAESGTASEDGGSAPVMSEPVSTGLYI
jgi:DNA polymerase III delta prime subunit